MDYILNLLVWRSRKNVVALAGLLLFVVISAISSDARATQTKFLTHSLGEQQHLDDKGELRGTEHGGRRAFYIELVREMMELMGHTKNIEEMPFKRALLLVQSNPGYALFNINRTEERENTLKWVGPLQSTVTYFYENSKAPTGIKSMNDAKRVASICVLRGNVHQRYLESHSFSNTYPANSYESCVRMLLLGRVSLTPLSNLSTLTRQPPEPDSPGLQKTPVKLMESEGYLAFSKETPDEEVKEWQAVLDKLKASGRYDELMELYLDDE